RTDHDERLLERGGDQPRAAVERDVRPGPLDHHDEPVAEADQEKDVDEQPEDPGEEAGEPEAADLADGGASADGGQHPFVDVVERLAPTTFEGGDDVPRGALALLDRGRGDARGQGAVRLDVDQVAEALDVVRTAES